MEESEALEAVAKGTVVGFTEPVCDLLKRLLGPAADEAGLVLRDFVLEYRSKRFRRFIDRTREMFGDLTAQPLPLKILLPIFENASLEDDDDLQDRWAALLVNSSKAKNSLIGAAEILKQLNSLEVLLLQMCYESFRPLNRPNPTDPMPVGGIILKWNGVLIQNYNFPMPAGAATHEITVMLTNLQRLGLLTTPSLMVNGGINERIYLTSLAFELIGRCQIPLPRP